MRRLLFITITALYSLSLSAQERSQWIAKTNFNIDGASYIETLAFVSGVSYALSESVKELNKQNKQSFFCAPRSQQISSEFIVSILNSKHSGKISAEMAISTVTKELSARFPCASAAYNNALKSLVSPAGTGEAGPLA